MKDIKDCKTIDELIEHIHDVCGTLAITHDYPSEQYIREWFDRYDFLHGLNEFEI